MICPRCRSTNVSVQVVNQPKLKEKRPGILWWLLIGWWWVPTKWLLLFVPALLVKLFAPKRYKLKNKTVTLCVCQHCGRTWRA